MVLVVVVLWLRFSGKFIHLVTVTVVVVVVVGWLVIWGFVISAAADSP